MMVDVRPGGGDRRLFPGDQSFGEIDVADFRDRKLDASIKLGLLGIMAVGDTTEHAPRFLPGILRRPWRAVHTDLEASLATFEAVLHDVGDQPARRHANTKPEQIGVADQPLLSGRTDAVDEAFVDAIAVGCHDPDPGLQRQPSGLEFGNP